MYDNDKLFDGNFTSWGMKIKKWEMVKQKW
jgi:hypothetical protein